MQDGSNICTDVTLTDTYISCRPPPMKTDIVKHPPTGEQNPTEANVTVSIVLMTTAIAWNFKSV